jgi:hypothetical protein
MLIHTKKVLDKYLKCFVDDTSIFTSLEYGNTDLQELLRSSQAWPDLGKFSKCNWW